jgi:hypothetical protein
LSVADAYRKATWKVFLIILVQFLLDISVGDQCGNRRKRGKIGGEGDPVSMNDVETFGLAIKIVGVARLILLFQVEGRLGIVLGGDRQDCLQPAGDLRISRSKKLHMMPAPIQLLAEVVDDALRSAMRPRWNGDINAGDLSDLHDGARSILYL